MSVFLTIESPQTPSLLPYPLYHCRIALPLDPFRHILSCSLGSLLSIFLSPINMSPFPPVSWLTCAHVAFPPDTFVRFAFPPVSPTSIAFTLVYFPPVSFVPVFPTPISFAPVVFSPVSFLPVSLRLVSLSP